MPNPERRVDFEGGAVERIHHLLVIGINEYADSPNIPSLRNARKDAEAIVQILIDLKSPGAQWLPLTEAA